MKILLLGSGGREHTLAWKISQSKHCTQLFISPGNAGTAYCGTNIDLDINDFEAQKKFCIDNNIDMIIVGPEDPLVNGVCDFFTKDKSLKNIIVTGPCADGAQLEGSKAFSKKFMQRNNIPTAAYKEFTIENFEEGKNYLINHSLPIVLKADGLAAGKGVVIAPTHDEAIKSFTEMLVNKQFGQASSKVVVEEFLQGIEASVFILTDGKKYKIIGHAKDYKRIGEGDIGPNTGGMGCVSPVPFVNEIFMQKVKEQIIEPTINGLIKENISYKGIIFFGLMNVKEEPYLIEYNCRMGDPETEVVIPKLKNDLLELLLAVHNETLESIEIEIDERACAAIVAVSGGYPNEYKKNIHIYKATDKKLSGDDCFIFHAGTKQINDIVFTNGGRVLVVSCFGKNIADAVNHSKKILEQIHFDGMYYRRDIGYEFE